MFKEGVYMKDRLLVGIRRGNHGRRWCLLVVSEGGICEYDATIRNEAKDGREAFEVHCCDLDSAGGCHGSLYCGRILRIVAA